MHVLIRIFTVFCIRFDLQLKPAKKQKDADAEQLRLVYVILAYPLLLVYDRP